MPTRIRHALIAVIKDANSRPMRRKPIAAPLRRELVAEFASEVDALSELTGRDFSHWLGERPVETPREAALSM